MVHVIGHFLTAVIVGLLLAGIWVVAEEALGMAPAAPWVMVGWSAFVVRLACWAHLTGG